ncbi:MAG: family 78 glycoside hydrolase catalytic domain [Flavobacteriaceae bacterium]|nr:family 78 glycoside hydrolase catalytic domain [Flavobacteriaceae bacterium]NVJ71649.1 family 78 glycoside hydrolase catalytic domain [Flavobacteriaceae bacterium]
MNSKNLKTLAIVLIVMSSLFSYAQKPVQLKVEYTSNPIGIDVEKPLFSWQIQTDQTKRGQLQTAYQIQVFNEQKELVWDSKKVISDHSVAIQYKGTPLQSRTRYLWNVSSWDEHNERYQSQSFFETGLLDTTINAWNGAQWIGTTMEDTPLASHYLSVFNLSYKLQLDQKSKSTKASFIFGANDSRLMDLNKNIQGVQSNINESYFAVELDISSLKDNSSKAKLHIYRVGYDQQDKEDIPFKSFEIPTDIINQTNAYHQHQIVIDGGMGGFDFYINDFKLNKATSSSPYANNAFNLNPIGKGHDYISFPMLADIGFKTQANQKAYFSDLKIKNKREPSNTLFEEELSNYKGIFKDIKIHNNSYVVGGTKNELMIANPSKNAVPHLRTSFKKQDKKIAKARIYTTARGIYELYLNGKRISEDLFNPGLTQYNKTHMYQTYDVTDLIEKDNVLGALLAEGWWSGNITYSGEDYWNFFGDRQSLLSQLIISYEDGSEQIITSNDKDWKYYKEGPIKVGSFFQGEIYDARDEEAIKGWTSADFDDHHWSSCVEIPLQNTTATTGIGYDLDFSEMQLIGQMGTNVIPSMELTAQSVEEVRPGVFVYDMGQNMVGVPKIRLQQGNKGSQITLRFAEVTYPNLKEYGDQVGMIMLENIRAALAQDIYIQKGGAETIQPRFTFHGYRYIEITGIEKALPLDHVKSIVISSVDQLTADYKTSDKNVNRLWDNIAWSTRANFLSIPTDCPQRNERMGWSGDINVFSKTATYMIDASQFLRRHLLAMREIQAVNGRFTDVAPVGGGFGGTLWGSAGVVVAWETYLQYGNTELLREHYPAMKRYVDFLESKQNEDGILDEGPLGDWLSPENSKNDNTAMWNAYQVYDLEIIYKSAEILGYTEDATKYKNKYTERKDFFNNTYFNPNNFKSVSAGYEAFTLGPKPDGYIKPTKGSIVDTQASYAIPLALNTYHSNNEKKAAEMLVNTINRSNKDDLGVLRPKFSLMTGFIGTAAINEALSKNGYDAIAYQLLLNDQYPSWLYPVVNGATTIWERLNSYTVENGFGGNNSMNSFNHYSFGAIGAWMQNYSLGIQRDPKAVAFKAIVLKPTPDPNNQLKWAEGHYDSMHGTIKSKWELKEDHTLYTISIPANTTATVYLKANSINDIRESGKKLKKSTAIQLLDSESERIQLKIGSGNYSFKVISNN